jgi:hypothetical protein
MPAAIIAAVCGCHSFGAGAKRDAELACPTDIRKTVPWCAGEDAIFHCPCGPGEEFYGHKATCWRVWPAPATVWRDSQCGAGCATCNGTCNGMCNGSCNTSGLQLMVLPPIESPGMIPETSQAPEIPLEPIPPGATRLDLLQPHDVSGAATTKPVIFSTSQPSTEDSGSDDATKSEAENSNSTTSGMRFLPDAVTPSIKPPKGCGSQVAEADDSPLSYLTLISTVSSKC